MFCSSMGSALRSAAFVVIDLMQRVMRPVKMFDTNDRTCTEPVDLRADDN